MRGRPGLERTGKVLRAENAANVLHRDGDGADERSGEGLQGCQRVEEGGHER